VPPFRCRVVVAPLAAAVRMLFLAGLALTLLGFGMRLRTADADDY